VIDTAPSIIFVKDRESRILLANETMARFYNLSVEEVTGRLQADLHRRYGARQEDVEQWLSDDREVIDTNQPKFVTEVGTDTQERVHWYQTSKFPIPVGEDQRGVLVISEDITQRKEAEESRKRAVERLGSLHEIDRAILGAKSVEEIADAGLSRIMDALPVARASVAVSDSQRTGIQLIAVRGIGEDEAGAGTRISREGYTVPESLRAAQTRVVDDLCTLPEPSGSERWLMERGFRAAVTVPIHIHGELMGSMNLSTVQAWKPSAEDLDFCGQVADSLAVAMEQCRLNEQLRAGRQRLQALSQRLLEVQEEERRAIARELHDEVGQLVTGMKLTLDMAVKGPLRGRGMGLEEARQLAEELLTRVRNLSLDLRPAMLDDLGLLPAFLWQLERFTTLSKIAVDFRHRGVQGRRFRRDAETAVFRIGQEALTNVARHSGVKSAAVYLWADPEALGLHVVDQGRGFDVGAVMAGWSSGLGGIRERVTLLGGRLDLEAAPGKGCRVAVELPLTGVIIERREGSRD
jgi:PAS domain S-box-containing protein